MKSNGELAKNFQILSDLLRKNRICDQVRPLENAKSICEANRKKDEWSYSLSNINSLEFSSLDISKNIRPIGILYKNLRLKLNIDVEGFFLQDSNTDRIKKLDLQIIIYDKSSEIPVNRVAWHIDKHFILKIDGEVINRIKDSKIPDEYKKKLQELKGEEFRDKVIFINRLINIFGSKELVKRFEDELIRIFGVDKFSHPEYHIQYGGNAILDNSNFNYGDSILIETPRIPFPPMDVFLAVDFILHNFISRDRHKNITEDPNYKSIIEKSKELIWKPYYLSIASKWEKSINTNWSYDSIMDGKFSL